MQAGLGPNQAPGEAGDKRSHSPKDRPWCSARCPFAPWTPRSRRSSGPPKFSLTPKQTHPAGANCKQAQQEPHGAGAPMLRRARKPPTQLCGLPPFNRHRAHPASERGLVRLPVRLPSGRKPCFAPT